MLVNSSQVHEFHVKNHKSPANCELNAYGFKMWIHPLPTAITSQSRQFMNAVKRPLGPWKQDMSVSEVQNSGFI